MTSRFLVVVDDSAAALHMAQVAIGLAASTGAGLTLVTVVEDHLLDAKLTAASIQDAPARRARGAQAMVTRVAARAAEQGVPAESEVLSGRGAEQVLAAAGRCGADLIVIAREPRAPAGSSVNLDHLLEFADIPVLVVPPAPER